MNWPPRKATQATQKIPRDWEEVYEKTYYRNIHLLIRCKIHLSLLVNMDQTGVTLIPGADSTFHERGVKQVHLLGKNEKRAFTPAVVSSCERDIPLFQAVWGRKTMGSCPKASVRREAESLGFHLTPANSEENPASHFSIVHCKHCCMNVAM